MDETSFDALTKALVAPRSRRRMLGVLSGGALASIVTALADAIGQAKGDGHAHSQGDRNRRTRGFQCKPAGTKCIHNPRKGMKATGKLCRKCCETFRKVSKKVGICCIPNGQPCESAAECCLGVCSVGICQNTTIQLLPPCVAYGGSCTQNGECCDGVPCSGSRCQFPPPSPPPPCVPRDQACNVDTDFCCLTLGDSISRINGFCRGT